MSPAVLWVYAHPAETEGLVLEGSRCIGVGKAAAAVACTQAILEVRPAMVAVFGVAGAYPGGPEVGELCLVAREWLADEGVASEQGFTSIAGLKLGDVGPFVADDEATRTWARRLGGVPLIDGATVSTCSATDSIAAEVAARTGAAVETMEGAAVALAAKACGVPWVELRAISNRCGDRARAGWDLARARDVLHAAVRTLSA